MKTFNLPGVCPPAKPTSWKDRFNMWLILTQFRYEVWSGYYTEKGEPLRCTNCDSWHHSDHIERVTDTCNFTPCEVEMTCKLCGNHMGYWAYGSWQPPF